MNEIAEVLVECVADGIFDSVVESLTTNKNDSKMQVVIQAYKKEMLQWFDSEGIEKENPMRYASQEQWYSLYLEKKRLASRSCKMQYVTYKHEPERYLEKPGTTCFYKKDGKYTMCEARQRTSLKKQYIRNGVVIGQKAKTYNIGYHILRSQNENGQYICPNCGAEQDLDKLLDGCDYCKSKFDISAYEDKVVSVMYNQNAFDYREGNSSYAIVMALSIVGVVFGLVGVCFSGGLSLGIAALGPKRILAQMGIQMDKACEVYVNCSNEDGSVFYGGWYHICGRIVHGDKVWNEISENHRAMDETSFVSLNDDYRIAFTDEATLLERDFPMPVIQMEFLANIPWVLSEKCTY